MLDSFNVLRLMIALIGALHLLLSYMGSRQANGTIRAVRAMAPIVVAVSAVLLLWVFVPDLMNVGNMRLSIMLRRVGLILGGAGVVARYLSVRDSVDGRLSSVSGYLATPMLGAGLSLATANYLVAAALAVLVVSVVIRQVARSRSEGPRQSGNPSDTQQAQEKTPPQSPDPDS